MKLPALAIFIVPMSRSVLTVVDIKITILWDVNSCCLLNRYNMSDKPLTFSSSLNATKVKFLCNTDNTTRIARVLRFILQRCFI
jgi:hypothetical protein